MADMRSQADDGTAGALARTSLLPAGGPAHPRGSGIGHALPVGAAGFALSSLVLGLYTTGHFSSAGESIVLPASFFYGGIVQLIAGFFALAAGATFAAAFLTAYGAFWLGYASITVWVAPHIASAVMSAPGSKGLSPQALSGQVGHTISESLGVFLLAWLVITVIFTIASLGTNAVTVAAFLLLDVTIVLLVVAYLGASKAGVPGQAVLHSAGWTEIALAAAAFYIVLAELANESLRRPVFPLIPLRRTT